MTKLSCTKNISNAYLIELAESNLGLNYNEQVNHFGEYIFSCLSLQTVKDSIRRARTIEPIIVPQSPVHVMKDDVKAFCIGRAKYALANYDDFETMSHYLRESLQNKYRCKRWHVTCFTINGGVSKVWPKKFLRITFGNIIIEMFYTL